MTSNCSCFAHGELTPNSGAGSPEPVRRVSEVICQFLFRVMDGEFTARLRANGFAA